MFVYRIYAQIITNILGANLISHFWSWELFEQMKNLIKMLNHKCKTLNIYFNLNMCIYIHIQIYKCAKLLDAGQKLLL